MTKILLVEDDGQIAAYLGELLRAEGFDTQIAGSKKEAGECLLAQAFDLVLLDVSLPDGNGFSICAEIKKEYEIPVIFLTASGDEYSVVAGLDMGADDYIAKPFRPRELISRIRSVLRRCKKEQRILSCGDLRVNVSSATVTKGEKELFLSALEYRLLLLLLQNKGQILTRNQLLEEIWDASGEYVNDNTLSVYMKRLREKIEENPQSPRLLHTIRGIGYRMEDRQSNKKGKNYMRPEYHKLIMADSMLAAAALIVLFVWGWQAAVCILFSALVLSGVFVSEIRRREAQASSLSDEIDRILYGEEHWNLDEYSEGELAILQDKVRKLVIRLREQADQLQKEKNFQAEMMADISHQLKTPLTAMRLMISSIRKLEGSGEDEVRQRARRLTEMQQLVDRVDSLVVVLLKMAKLDSGTAILQKEKISIKDLILHSAEPLAISMDLHGVKLCLNGNDTDSFLGDFRWSAEAITNILKNGIEHMENGGNLCVSWRETSVYSEIVITDEGSGISDEELPHIFERFYRGKTARHSGFGIGMAMAQSIFAKQNGTIKAQNREEGGAKFVIHVCK